MVAASSNHPGGVNMAFLDGSVKFIKNSINLGTYAALGTKAGGEVIDADQLLIASRPAHQARAGSSRTRSGSSRPRLTLQE